MAEAKGGKRGPPSTRGDSPADKTVSTEYDDVGSPSDSSTASGPVYVRPPGFHHHGQAIQVKTRCGQLQQGSSHSSSRGFWNTCKKKRSVICVGYLHGDQDTPKVKPKKEPLPMKLRALPQSFWQQPNQASEVSPAITGPILPPLFKTDSTPDDETTGLGMEEQAVTPPGSREHKGSACSTRSEGSRILRVSNTDLLLKLFEGINEKKNAPVVKRGRPKKVPSNILSRTIRGEDPCLVSTATEGLLPLLNVDKCSLRGATSTLTLVAMRDGDKTVSLPALNIDHNYSQMLSELVVKL